jgi:hypothetical protein
MELNYWGIVLCTILNVAWARVWYDTIFNKPWHTITHRSNYEKPVKSEIVVSVILGIVLSLGVNIVSNLLGISNPALGLLFGLILSIFFIAPVIMGEWIWDKKDFVLVLIDAGFYITFFIAAFFLFSLFKI